MYPFPQANLEHVACPIKWEVDHDILSGTGCSLCLHHQSNFEHIGFLNGAGTP
jgi:hypothetical protein